MDDQQDKNAVEADRERSEKEIQDRLSKIKSEGVPEGTLESKMPHRTEVGAEIEVPRPRHSEQKGVMSSDVHSQPLTYKKDKAETVEETPDDEEVLGQGEEEKEAGGGSLLFGAGKQVSRGKFKSILKRGEGVWQASRSSKLNLSPLERAKLVKEVFPAKPYGKYISKEDLGWRLRKLNQQLRKESVKANPEKHRELRRKIDFLKKVGGL